MLSYGALQYSLLDTTPVHTLCFRWVYHKYKDHLLLADQDILNALFGLSPWYVSIKEFENAIKEFYVQIKIECL